jgi:hypothetical protein
MSEFPTLDALAERFPLGMIRYRAGTHEPLGRIVGYVWGIPRHAGGPKVASLVIETDRGTVGNIYPDEITRHDRVAALNQK